MKKLFNYLKSFFSSVKEVKQKYTNLEKLQLIELYTFSKRDGHKITIENCVAFGDEFYKLSQLTEFFYKEKLTKYDYLWQDAMNMFNNAAFILKEDSMFYIFDHINYEDYYETIQERDNERNQWLIEQMN